MKKIRTTKTGRLFQTIFLLQCLLLGCMLIYVTVLMNRLVIREQTRELDVSNLRVLEQKSRSIDNTVDRLKEQVRLFLTENTVMQHLVTPQEENAENRMEILTLLQRYVQLSAEVEAMWLYRPGQGDVLSSDGFFTARKMSSVAALLARYEGIQRERCEPDLFLTTLADGGNLYLILEFAPAARLGCFIFRLDQQRIGTSSEDGEAGILIVEENGSLLMDGSRLTEEEVWIDLDRADDFYTENSENRRAGQIFYRVDNDKLDWSLLLRMSAQQPLVRRSGFWAVTLPVLIVLLLLGAVAAWYITRRVYTPINRLLALAADQPARKETGDLSEHGPDSGKQKSSGRSEPDYLEAAWRQTLEDNQQLRSRFRSAGMNMRQYFCRQAIRGGLIAEEGMEPLEAVIPRGCFQAVLFRLRKGGLELQNPLQFSLISKALKQLASQMPSYFCSLEESPETFVLILAFQTPAGKPEEADMEALANQAEKETGCRLAYGMGIACENFAGLQESFEHANRELQYKLYLSGDPKTASGKGEEQWKKALNEHLAPLIESALQSDAPVEEFARQITRTAEYGAGNETEKQRGYLYAQDLLLEKLMFQEELLAGLKLVREEDSPEKSREVLLVFAAVALEKGRELAGKKQYWYVEEGKAFMRDNFQNPSLGVADISAHVGISAAYFSSLFNELSQESVTSYLNRLRVEQAKTMLRTTHIPVKEVGFRCGFNSANVFGRVFKKYTGQSPKQYRDMQ